jgi:hypothetical protein
MSYSPSESERYCRRKAQWCREKARETGGVIRRLARQLAELWEQMADKEQAKHADPSNQQE